MRNIFSGMGGRTAAHSAPSLADDPGLARAAQQRLIKIRARCTEDIADVLRQAKKLRRELLRDARSSHRHLSR